MPIPEHSPSRFLCGLVGKRTAEAVRPRAVVVPVAALAMHGAAGPELDAGAHVIAGIVKLSLAVGRGPALVVRVTVTRVAVPRTAKVGAEPAVAVDYATGPELQTVSPYIGPHVPSPGAGRAATVRGPGDAGIRRLTALAKVGAGAGDAARAGTVGRIPHTVLCLTFTLSTSATRLVNIYNHLGTLHTISLEIMARFNSQIYI